MMPSQYLDEYVRELKRDGEAAIRSRYQTPVLIVTKTGGELHGGQVSEATVTASSAGWRMQEVSLLNRVFAVTKATFALPGPISLGRLDSADISIPEESISKRHCTFDIEPDSVRVTDCGSTNGTTVDGAPLAPQASRSLRGGEVLAIGNFSFLFHTATSFLRFLNGLAGPSVPPNRDRDRGAVR